MSVGLSAGALRADWCIGIGLRTIGFVGLIIPHVSRAIAGTAHRKLLPIAALSGGLFMLWVDAIARSLIPNTELPVGIFTALVGAPFFVYVMVRKKYGFGGN